MKGAVFAVLLSAFVWPGAGQLYNREFRKAVVLIALTTLITLSFMIGAEAEILRRLPDDITGVSFEQVRAAIKDVLDQRSDYVTAFNVLMLASWLYSVVDAYLGAKDRANRGGSKSGAERVPDEE